MDQLSQLSDALAAHVEASSRSVVRVEGRQRLPSTGIVFSADGLIVTADHSVRRDENIHVGLPDGRSVPASLLGRDPTTDLALVKAEAADLAPARFAPAGGLRVGQLVLALGRPGDGVQATLGVISALGDAWHTPAGGELDRYVQTDVVMYPGFSGGPLVDANGAVVGLNSSALLRGVSLTVPTGTIQRVADTLRQHGRIRRGYLGVGAQPVRLPVGLGEQYGGVGLLLVSVEPGSPAEQGGLHLGDVLLAVDGQRVQDLDDLLALLAGERVGKPVTVQLLRGGQVSEVTVVVGERS